MKNNIFLKIFLLLWALVNFINALVFMFTVPNDNWLGFSRVSIAVITLGIYGIIEAIESKKS
jgi:hypothetical protein